MEDDTDDPSGVTDMETAVEVSDVIKCWGVDSPSVGDVAESVLDVSDMEAGEGVDDTCGTSVVV